MTGASDTPTRRAIDAIWRIESPRIIASVARVVGDVGVAEDLAHDALVTALERWPSSGVPDNPGAWLTVTARHRAYDLLRRTRTHERKVDELGHDAATRQRAASPEPPGAALEHDDVDDDLLRLMFVACHPVLSRDAQVALTLRLLGGLTTAEIARAFLVAEATVGQRISRAKRTLAEARVPFEVPDETERAARLSSVLEVVYLIFNEGYAATSGDDWMRLALCEDALRLGRVLAGLVPDEAEVHGLLALLELQASRTRARTGPAGEAVLLDDQDRSRWDHVLVRRGLASLARAERLARPLGPYTLQAEIAACHARAPSVEETDWVRIVACYDALAALGPSPIVALNRAVAVGRAFGPVAGIQALDAIGDEPALARSPYPPAVRGDLLAQLGRLDEARDAFTHAASRTDNEREAELLRRRAASCVAGRAQRQT